MLIHFVVFWLKKGLSEEEKKSFLIGVHSLSKISGVEQTFIGKPADTPQRPVVDNSYDCALTVVLKDMEAHDAYQNDTIHLDFIKNYSQFWEKVLIFDAD